MQGDGASDDPFVMRNELIGRARNGEISADEAEAEAERSGCGPLATTPADGTFDPMAQSEWTLPMSVAWIAWRSIAKVREAWDAYTQECWDWHFQRWRVGFDGPVTEGYVLEQRQGVTVERLRLDEILEATLDDEPPVKKKTVYEAVDDLVSVLAESILSATGDDAYALRRVAVPHVAWRDLKLAEQRERDVLMDQRNLQEQYAGITLPAERLRDLWPASLPDEWSLPALKRPNEKGRLPLFRAAHWIATEGGTVTGIATMGAFEAAYTSLLEHIQAGHLELIGKGKQTFEHIDPILLAGCRLSTPLGEIPDCTALGSDMTLVPVPYLDEHRWHDGASDNIRSRSGSRWTKLMVSEEAVAQLWPHDGVDLDQQGMSYRTGAPGRPGSSHLAVKEFAARAARGDVLPTLKAEAEYLSSWQTKTHPQAHPNSSDTIKNVIREKYNEYKAQKATKR